MENQYDILAAMTGFNRKDVKKIVHKSFMSTEKTVSEELLLLLVKAVTINPLKTAENVAKKPKIISGNEISIIPPESNFNAQKNSQQFDTNPSQYTQSINSSPQDNAIRYLTEGPKTTPDIAQTHANYGRDSADSAAGGPERRALANQAAAAAVYGQNSSEQAKGSNGKPFVASNVATMEDEPIPANIQEEEQINPTIDETDDTETRNKMHSAQHSIYTALGWDPDAIKEYRADPNNPKWNQYTTRKPYGSETAVGGPEPSVAEADARAADYLNNNSGGKKYNPVTGQWEPVRRSMFPSTFKKSFFFLNTLEV
jgi:hypothetical protein